MRRQRIVETVHCDRCGNETADAQAFTIEVGTLGSPLRRTIDVCPEHAQPIVELIALLRSVKPPPKPPTDGRRADPVGRATVQCDVCGDALAAVSLSSHIVKKHHAVVKQPAACPDCGNKLDSVPMLKHRAKFHGYDHAAALYASLQPQPKRKRSR